LPILSKLVKKYHCITASSAPSERAFSKLKIVVGDLRNRIDPEKVADLIGLQSLIINDDYEAEVTFKLL
jgi:hypothetical protein